MHGWSGGREGESEGEEVRGLGERVEGRDPGLPVVNHAKHDKGLGFRVSGLGFRV